MDTLVVEDSLVEGSLAADIHLAGSLLAEGSLQRIFDAYLSKFETHINACA